jgi:predicted CXXCH cytochrome family protein
MKKLLVLSAFFTLLASPVLAAIEGSKHDFTQPPYSGTEICIFCHTPHNASILTDAPLWKRDLPLGSSFTVYESTTMVQIAGEPGNVSLICLSCHDGSIAIDDYNTLATPGTKFIELGGLIGKELKNDHPIGVIIDTANDANLKTPTNAVLFNDRVECASCHDVHRANEALPSMLITSNEGSALCLDCHDK